VLLLARTTPPEHVDVTIGLADLFVSCSGSARGKLKFGIRNFNALMAGGCTTRGL